MENIIDLIEDANVEEWYRSRYRSLFIVGVPRSCSSALQIICSKALGFRYTGEIFNVRWGEKVVET